MISRQLHAISCDLGIITLGNAFGFASYNYTQPFSHANYTYKHVTNCEFRDHMTIGSFINFTLKHRTAVHSHGSHKQIKGAAARAIGLFLKKIYT